MNKLMVFEGNNVEVLELNGKVLFNPKHVGECLDIENVTVRKHIKSMDEDEVIKLTNSDVTSSNIRKLNNAGENFLTEEGVYSLIFKSRKPDAIKFQKWVTKEVLPSIRNTGGFVKTGSEAEFIENYFPSFSENVKLSMVQDLLKTNEVLKPKAENYDILMNSCGNIDFGEFAKSADLTKGRNGFMQLLRDNKILMVDSVLPYQNFIDTGYFKVISVVNNNHSYNKVLITKKGQDWLLKKCKKWEIIKCF